MKRTFLLAVIVLIGCNPSPVKDETFAEKTERIYSMGYETGQLNGYKDIMLYLRLHKEATGDDVRNEINRLVKEKRL